MNDLRGAGLPGAAHLTLGGGTPAAYPLALVRLAHALIEAGYETVAAPACAGCGKITVGLRRKTTSGRVCEACAARGSTGTWARCGRARRINARRPEGGICSACYDNDEQVVTECSGCGRRRRTAARMLGTPPRPGRRSGGAASPAPGTGAAAR